MKKALIISNVLTLLITIFALSYAFINNKYLSKLQTENEALRKEAEIARLAAYENEMMAVHERLKANETFEKLQSQLNDCAKLKK